MSCQTNMNVTGNQHNPELTVPETVCIEILKKQAHGRENAISAAELTRQVFCSPGPRLQRDLRELVNHLVIQHRIPILSAAGFGGGYFMPATTDEVNQFYHAMYARAMTGLVKACQGRKASFVQVVEQMTLWFDCPEESAFQIAGLVPDQTDAPAFVQVLTNCMDRMSKDPAKYAAEIRAVQERYGDIFVPKDYLRRLKEQTASLNKLLEGLAA